MWRLSSCSFAAVSAINDAAACNIQKIIDNIDNILTSLFFTRQLIVTDFKYFNRIKWQYVVLDEAQAIKSSSSQRWKMLLEFKCRNRLLLSGTPIQNTMAELWSLLHFVMPTLFDSHEEFNDWFSKDIESSADGSKNHMDQSKYISMMHSFIACFNFHLATVCLLGIQDRKIKKCFTEPTVPS